VLSVLYFIAGRPWGLEGVALAQTILDCGGWAIRHSMANRVIGLSWREFARALTPVWITQAALLLAVVSIRWILIGFVEDEAGRLAAGFVVASLGYLVTLRMAMPGVLTSLGRGARASLGHAIASGLHPPPQQRGEESAR
jgi:hypothetical protein